MTVTHKKYLIGGLVLILAVGYLVYAGIKSGSSYYMQVDEFMADSKFHEHRVRLHGTVVEDNVSVEPENMKASFDLAGQKSRLHVIYHGVVPDLFKPGGDVVVEGRLGPDGVFKAEQLITKCASKYKEMGKQLEESQ